MCSWTLATAFSSISGPVVVPSSRPLPILSLADRHFQLLGERVVDRILDVQAVGADAGLAVVAVFGNDRAFDGLIQVRVVEHDERRVAAQFQGNLLDVLGAFGHQLATDLGRAV